MCDGVCVCGGVSTHVYMPMYAGKGQRRMLDVLFEDRIPP